MKSLALILTLVWCTQLSAQSDFLHIDQAFQYSKKESKPIMLVFSGSDWCKPCIKLKKSILESKDFHEISDQLIFMYLDFPYKKANRLSKEKTKHNEKLAERYNKKGYFPRIVFIDNNGQILNEIIYKKGMSTEKFISNTKKIIKAYGNDKI